MQLAVTMRVRSLDEHRRFCGDILGFAEHLRSDGVAFRLGDGLLLLEEDPTATIELPRQALGWRYITLQVADIDTVHSDLWIKGVREALTPITLGDRAAIARRSFRSQASSPDETSDHRGPGLPCSGRAPSGGD